jgi:Protein of unknown function (DUF3638)
VAFNVLQLVREFTTTLNRGGSLVKQMIMGQGKTTVVGPLLALMLADGRPLVVQVVPPALLEFSRGVLRSTFSSIIHKRIFTLTFDRTSQADESTLRKLATARTSKGIVVATPMTVKSIMLKLVEDMQTIGSRENDIALSGTSTLELSQQIGVLTEIVRMFREGYLIIDEIDLVLNPLKSLLNWPRGDKHDLDFAPLRWQLPIHILHSPHNSLRTTFFVVLAYRVRSKVRTKLFNSTPGTMRLV